jgi:hypothetical protein
MIFSFAMLPFLIKDDGPPRGAMDRSTQRSECERRNYLTGCGRLPDTPENVYEFACNLEGISGGCLS